MRQCPYKTISNSRRLFFQGHFEKNKASVSLYGDGSDLSVYPIGCRFDIALVLRDRRDEELDGKVADHILDNYSGRHKSDDGNSWGLEELKSYFAFIKTLRPRMTKDAEEYLMRSRPVHMAQNIWTQ